MDCILPGSSVHGNSSGKNTGVGCHFLLHEAPFLLDIRSQLPAPSAPVSLPHPFYLASQGHLTSFLLLRVLVSSSVCKWCIQFPSFPASRGTSCCDLRTQHTHFFLPKISESLSPLLPLAAALFCLFSQLELFIFPQIKIVFPFRL